MATTDDSKKDPAADQPAGKKDARRRPYVAPRLQEFGSVTKLTGTKSGSGTDGTMQMTVCL